MLDFLKSLIGGRPLALIIDKADITEVSLDLKVLDSVDPGLGKRATAYVLTGEGGSVLLELEQRKAAINPVLSHYHHQNRNQEGLAARQRVLTRRHGPEASWLRRYGEVLSVQHTGSRWGIGAHQGPSPVWLRSLILGACQGRPAQPLPLCADFDAMLSWRDSQESAAVIALDIFVIETATHFFSKRLGSNFYDFAKHLPEEYPAVSAAFASFERPGQVAIINLLKTLGLVTGPYFDFIYEQYLSSPSKPVREAAQNALLAAPAQRLTEKARATLAEGNPTARGMAAQLLPIVLKEEARPILEAHLATETAKTVRRIIELGLGAAVVSDPAQPAAARTLAEDGPAGYLAADGTEVLAPAAAPLPGPSPVSERVRAGYRKLLERAYDSALKHYEYQKERYEKATAEQRSNWWRSGAPAPPRPSDPQNADRYCDVLAATGSVVDHPVLKLDRVHVFAPWGGNAAASAPFNDPELTLWHLTRAYALHSKGHANRGGTDILSGMSAIGDAIRTRLVDGFDLRTVAALLPAPVAGNALIRALLTAGYYGGYYDLPDDGVWPFMCQHFAEIDQAFGLTAAANQDVVSPRLVMERLQAFPKLPARYFLAVLGHAIGQQKSLSAPARALLMTVDGVERRLIPYLEDGKQDVRVGVATMLGSLGAESAVEPLKKALAKEKSDLVRAAFLGALQRLKIDISGYVSSETLAKEAVSGLKKAKDIPWFPFAALPALAWSDGGAVPAEIVRWWILLAAKLAQPGGNALFRLWLDQLQPASAEALGRHILASFLSYDATPFPEREANAYAEANAQKRFEYYQDLAKRYNNNEHFRSMTYERVFAALRAEKMAIYVNNAYAERGILGLAVRADGAHAVQLTKSYMRDHYTRTSQVRALTEYLGGNSSAATLQLLLSVARRHRTKQVQALAGQLVERIADERGWTAEELADRTVPTAGLDERGVLELPIGDRVYEAKLEADDTLVLYNPAGKAVKALPQVSEGPEKAAAAEAKTALSNAKKELAQVYEFQAKRLYEALCTGRLWPTAEWTQYLLEHPIVGRLVQRLVWLGLDGDRTILAAFRPLADLSLSDAEDQPAALGDFAKVQLAHGSLLPVEESAKWQQHLDDYKVAPLFAQFGRPLLLAGKTGTVIADRRGHVIEAFKLRSIAQKLGYDRGAAGDGGWFTEYLKPFPSIGITAVIEFTGSPLPEENREVALTEARFMATGGKRRSLHGSGMALEKVPPVLLSEVWNDLHQVAASGTGFAEDWQKRTSW